MSVRKNVKKTTVSQYLADYTFDDKSHIRKTQDGVSLVRFSCFNEEEEEVDLENLISLKNPQTDFENLRGKIFLEDMQRENWTQREKDILSLSLNGLTVREIGEKLGISHVMVVKLRNKIREKCQKFRRFL